LNFIRNSQKTVFCLLYDGNIVDDVTDKIIDLSEFNYESQDNYKKARKKVSFLLAECFQNIIRHGENLFQSHTDKVDFGFFLTRFINDTYFISSANLIKTANVANLKSQLNKVNSLDKDSLKALYLEMLENKSFSDKGGAGLGLIEIARKSGQKIEYVIDEYQDDYSIFYNQIMLKDEKQVAEHSGYRIVEAMELHRKMMAEEIIMVQKGDFSKNFINPVLNILDKNIDEANKQANPRKRAYHVLVELIQSMSKHALKLNDKKEGVFLLKRKDNGLIIGVGSFIEKHHVKPLERQLSRINTLTKKEIKAFYLKALNEEHPEIRIELLEIAKYTEGPIRFSFDDAIDGQIFFAITVSV
jgi:DnaJ-domain-containing protein 1